MTSRRKQRENRSCNVDGPNGEKQGDGQGETLRRWFVIVLSMLVRCFHEIFLAVASGRTARWRNPALSSVKRLTFSPDHLRHAEVLQSIRDAIGGWGTRTVAWVTVRVIVWSNSGLHARGGVRFRQQQGGMSPRDALGLPKDDVLSARRRPQDDHL